MEELIKQSFHANSESLFVTLLFVFHQQKKTQIHPSYLYLEAQGPCCVKRFPGHLQGQSSCSYAS